MAKQKNIPILRFSEFRDAGEWEEKVLGDICHHFKGFAFKSKYYTTSGRRIVRVSDMGFDYIKNETSAIYIKEDEAKLYKKWKLVKDDLIVTTVGSKPPVYDSLVGRTIVVKLKDEGSLLNQNAVCLRAKKNIEQRFLNSLFRRNEYILFIESIIRGNANQGSIALVDLFKYKILQPKPKEQQKIANCLSSIDALITAQTQKLDALKAHKKGLMQKLFPAKGETIPKLRFPEFRDAGNWSQKSLGCIGEFTGGGTPSRNNDSYWGGNIPWISSSDISEDSIHRVVISRFITKEAVKESATKLIPENSILLVSRVGVGKLAITKNQLCTSQDFTNFTPAKDNLTFLAYYLKSLKDKLLAYSQGMAIKGFTKEDISKLELFLPHTREQQKIANCLASIDTLITAQTQKIEALKAHKKGLMQQLFPATDEEV